MQKKTFPVSENMTILVKAHGDLDLQGWDQMEVYPLTERRRTATVQVEGEIVRITLLDDGEVFIPSGAAVQVERVGGDACIRRLAGKLAVERVGGDLALQNVAETLVSTIGGDCTIVELNGSLAIHRVGGDFVAAAMQGSASVGNIGGDADLQMIEGNADIKAGGDICLRLDATGEQLFSLRSGGDTNVYLPKDPAVEINILCRGEDIRLRLNGEKKRIEQRAHQFSLGTGTAKINVQAGGDVLVTDENIETECFSTARENLEEHWADVEESRSERETVEDEEAFARGEDISRRVNRHVDEAMRRADERIAAAMRRVEERTHQIALDGMIPPMPPIPTVGRPRKSILILTESKNSPAQPTQPGGSTIPAAPKPQVKSPISEEERMLVLSMLQEKKISAEEAARLLEALERS